MPSLNTDELTANLQAYHRKHNDYIHRTALLNFDIMQAVTVRPDITHQETLMYSETNGSAKPYSSTFKPTADAVKLIPRILQVRKGKADFSFEARKLHSEYVARWKAPGANPYNLPLEHFIIEEIGKQVKADLEIHTLYEGKHNAAGQAPKDIADGWLTIAKADTKIEKVVIAPLTKGNIIEELEKIAKIIPARYKRKKGIYMHMTANAYELYLLAYRDAHGSLNYNNSFEKMTLDGNNIQLFPVDGISNDNDILVSTKENMILGVDAMGDISAFEVEKNHRMLDFLFDYSIGMEFQTPHEVWIGGTA